MTNRIENAIIKTLEFRLGAHGSPPEYKEEVMQTVRKRIEQGNKDYGPWLADDPRNYICEAFEELVDAMEYLAAEIHREHTNEDEEIRKSLYLAIQRLYSVAIQLVDLRRKLKNS